MTASKLHRENQALCSPILAVQLHTQNLTLLEPEIFLKDGKDSDAGRDWGQEKKGTTEDEMAGRHHRLDGREFE